MESVSADIPMQHFLVLSSVLFTIGVYGVLSRRSAVIILMSVELMLNAVSINMVAFAVYTAPSLFVGIIFADKAGQILTQRCLDAAQKEFEGLAIIALSSQDQLRFLTQRRPSSIPMHRKDSVKPQLLC